MKQGLAVFAIALALSSGVAAAQTSETTTTQSTAGQPGTLLAPPVPGTVTTTRESHAVDAAGNRVDSTASSYSGPAPVVVAPPPPPPVTTSTTTTRTTTTSVPN